MSARRFKSRPGEESPIRVASVKRTCYAMPAQWEGMTDDGRRVYARYRNSSGYVSVGAHGDLSEYAAVSGATVVAFEREHDAGDRAGGWDGDLSETELRAITAPYVTWPDDMQDAEDPAA